METDEGGWTVIQRRTNSSSVNFYRGWDDYVQGFGDLEKEFWWGLRKIHCLTNRDEVELRIDMKDESGNEVTRSSEWMDRRISIVCTLDRERAQKELRTV